MSGLGSKALRTFILVSVANDTLSGEDGFQTIASQKPDILVLQKAVMAANVQESGPNLLKKIANVAVSS
jgi:hypothetical protein